MMFSKKSISFVIPAYNCSKTLSEAVDSIYKGNFIPGDEVIIVDDASTDETLTKIKNLQKKYSGIKVYRHHYNKGTAAAGRNTAIDHSKNELIFCLDADNVLCRRSIFKLREFLISNSVDAAAFGGQYYFKDNIKNITHKWIYYSVITLENCINESIKTPGPSGNYLFTKESWIKAGKYFEPTLLNQTIDSWAFLIRQLATGSRMLTLRDTYYFHRFGHDSHFVRENKQGNVSLSALVALIPFLDRLDDSDLEYIMSKRGRYNWVDNLKKHPIRLKSSISK